MQAIRVFYEYTFLTARPPATFPILRMFRPIYAIYIAAYTVLSTAAFW